MLEQKLGRAGGREDAWKSEHAHADRPGVDDHFGDGAAEPTGYRVLFDGDDGAAGAEVHRVATVGETTAERVFSGVLLGDLVSLYLAVLRGVDPGPVDVIEALKGELASQ